MVKSNTIKFSMSELQAYVQDENALVECVTKEYHMALKPWCLANVKESLQKILEDGVGKYDRRWEGILLSTKNIKMLSSLGTFRTDTADIHIEIMADFYVFKPELGSLLQGVVIKKSDQLLGVLVHKVFNVSIPKPVSEKNWAGKLFEIGQNVTFRVIKLDLLGQLPYIRGDLEPSSDNEETDDDSGISNSEYAKQDEEDAMEEIPVARKPKKQKSQNGSIISDDVVVKIKKHKNTAETSPPKQANKKHSKASPKKEHNLNEQEEIITKKKCKKSKQRNEDAEELKNSSLNDSQNLSTDKSPQKKRKKVSIMQNDTTLTDPKVNNSYYEEDPSSIISELMAHAKTNIVVPTNTNEKKSKKDKKQLKGENDSISKSSGKKRKLDMNKEDEAPKTKKAKLDNSIAHSSIVKTPQKYKRKSTSADVNHLEISRLSAVDTNTEETPNMQKISKSGDKLTVGRRISESFDQSEIAVENVVNLKSNPRRKSVIGISSELKDIKKQKNIMNTPDKSIIEKKRKFIDNLPNDSILSTPDLTSTAKKPTKKRKSSVIDLQLEMIRNIMKK